MRIGGLASGIDTDELVNKLMTAERMPLDKMKQQQQKLEWQRDGFRDINKLLAELDSMAAKMLLTTSYSSKKVTSSQENAVTATGSTSASEGTYNIEVTEIARGEMLVGKSKTELNGKTLLKDLGFNIGDQIALNTAKNKEENGNEKPIVIEVEEGDTIDSVLKKITSKNQGVRAFFDTNTSKVILETTYTGIYNETGSEISFEGKGIDLFQNKLGFDGERNTNPENPASPHGQVTIIKANNAEFNYNGGITLTSQKNTYTMNGVTFNFKNKTEGSASLAVANNTDEAFDNVMKFIDKYNEVAEKLYSSQKEQTFRSFQPLSDEQKQDMTEEQIKKWEEKAKSGILKGESIISNSLYSLRGAFYPDIKDDRPFKVISDIGLTTSRGNLDGKITLKDGSEEKLRKALAENPEAVYQLFTAGEKGDPDAGIIRKLRASIDITKEQINKRAGRVTDPGRDSYTIGKNMKDLDKRIADFEKRMQQVETRYWNQFNAMEKAINRLNSQSAQMLSQFGGQ